MDLVVDVRRSQICDLDQLLKAYLYYVLKKDSQKKIDLDKLQERIEDLERKMDTHSRAKAAEKRAQNAKNQAEGEPTNY